MSVDVRRFFRELNLFKRNTVDEDELHIQRWSTRLYIVLLFTALLILFIYTILQVESKQITINNPSLTTYIKISEKFDNIKCPCTDISIAYRSFLTLSPIYHQVCSSDFVSERWIQFLYERTTTTIRYQADFRASAFNHFQLLRSLCELSFNAINDGLETFYQSLLISGELLNQDQFSAQVEADISAIQTITTSHFLRSFTFLRTFLNGNELLTSIPIFYHMRVYSTDINTRPDVELNFNYFVSDDYPRCNCAGNFRCNMPAGLYNVTWFRYSSQMDLTIIHPEILLRSWRISCWPLESLLLSTLELFYDQTILDTITSYINPSTSNNHHFQALNRSIRSNVNSNDTIEILVIRLFIENWLKTLNYSSYFSQCQPEFCQYIINNRRELIHMITSFLGLSGGLSAILRFIVPHFIQIIFTKLKQRQSISIANEETDMNGSFYRWLKTISHSVLHFNFYRSSLRIRPIDIKHQIWSTRMFIGLLIFSLFILTVYSGASLRTQIIKIDNPSLTAVQELESFQYSLTCPCQDLSVDYKFLFELKPVFHQLCSSIFVTNDWISYVIRVGDTFNRYVYKDFHYTSPFSFQLLKSLCSLSNETINNALFEFGQRQLVTNELLPIDLFTNQMNSVIEEFKLRVPNNFLRLSQLSRNILHVNQLVSALGSNFRVDYYVDNQTSMIKPILRIYGYNSLASDGSNLCSCAFDTICRTNSVVYYYDQNGYAQYIRYTLPNFYVKCFPLESLLGSTLECFYDNNPCFYILYNHTMNAWSYNWIPLNSLEFSHFRVNVTVDELLENLFLESWLTKFHYSSYFDRCQPIYCTYPVTERRSLLKIITVVFGLIGGLSKILKILSPYIISIGFNFIQLYQQRHSQREINAEQEQSVNISNQNISRRKRLIEFWMNIWNRIKTLNLFEDENNPSVNEQDIYIKQQSTRLYLILLLSITLIVGLYTSFIHLHIQVIEDIYSFDDYIKFQSRHNDISIKCPCTKLSIVRSTFFQMEPKFHDVCSSDFVSYRWLHSLFDVYRNLTRSPINALTFRGTAYSYFQALTLICNLTKHAVIDARDLFLTATFVSSQMLSPSVFYLYSNSTFKDFQITLSDNFFHNLNMFRELMQGNGLVSVYSTNWNLFFLNLTIDQRFYMTSRIYNECDCAISSECIQYSIPYFPGYYVGCLPLEGFLRSTVECLYDRVCVEEMSKNMNLSYYLNSLNQSHTRFNINTTIHTIIEDMFIETWLKNISYQNFFQQCQPTSCSYIIQERFNLLYTITTLIGLLGGIIILLKLFIPIVVNELYKRIHIFQRRNRQVYPLKLK